jgi:hypothetical protein
MDILSSSLED